MVARVIESESFYLRMRGNIDFTGFTTRKYPAIAPAIVDRFVTRGNLVNTLQAHGPRAKHMPSVFNRMSHARKLRSKSGVSKTKTRTKW